MNYWSQAATGYLLIGSPTVSPQGTFAGVQLSLVLPIGVPCFLHATSRGGPSSMSFIVVGADTCIAYPSFLQPEKAGSRPLCAAVCMLRPARCATRSQGLVRLGSHPSLSFAWSKSAPRRSYTRRLLNLSLNYWKWLYHSRLTNTRACLPLLLA